MTNKLVKQSTANSAWTAGGESVASVAGNLQASWTFVAGDVGALVGLAPAGTTPAFAAVEHGILAQAGQLIQVVEAGVVVATSTTLFTADTTVLIQRVGTLVGYQVGNWSYQSSTASSGTKDLLAVLYAPGDAVEAATIAAYTQDISTAQLGSTLTVSDTLLVEPILYGLLTNLLTLSSTASGGVEVTTLYTDYLAVLSSYTTVAEYTALLSSVLHLRDTAGVSAQGLLQYATSLAGGAVGRYQGFDFNGFCQVGMDTYAFKADGLYKLRQGDDNGVAISALVEFAAEALAGTMQSRLEKFYYGLSTDGQVFVRVIDDSERETVYRARPIQNDMQMVKAAQGINSRYWRMRLELVDATFAQLTDVTWQATATGRRTNS